MKYQSKSCLQGPKSLFHSVFPFCCHLSPENDKPMKGLRQEDLVNQDLITELRKEFSMTHDDFYMILTDTDMRVKVGLAETRPMLLPTLNIVEKT